ncbi:hypothetical protein SAMN05421665_1238 [Yoonia rosea]|uniref:Uncharacterized protein n=1 Tax=Yoonia rosea TaxID=287098 RepID=A0A1R3WT78_9RHOB|nr:hypothetical protein SAMN05421665_1238 [Yoonia rosea]
MTDTTNNTPATEMTAWDMASSCLVGLHKSQRKARSEYEAALAASGNNPLGAGVSAAARVINVVAAATRVLEQDMRQHARSAGLVMPQSSSDG